jgi:signal transduction histidine kinase/CheY-like chemotaxis protein
MTETIILSKDVIESFNILESGIMVVDRQMQIVYCNPWIRIRLPENLTGLENLNKISDHYAYSSVLSRVKQVFLDAQPIILSPVFHKFIIPLFDTKNSDCFMSQQGVVKPVVIKEPHHEEEKLCAFFQIVNVSNVQMQMRELEKAISDRKSAELKAKAAMQQADAANQAKSAFLANMSHELRTPLNAIIGFTEILGLKLTSILNPKQLGYFKRIKESGLHLLEMVNDILDLSKIEAQKIEINFRPFNFGEMLRRSPSIIQSQAEKKNLQIDMNLQTDLGWLNGDETRLKQVIYNLLSNAIKFTESGSRIGIDAITEENDFLVTVWDEGIGISKEHLEKIFDPFEQISMEVSTEPGTGLGLSISKKLVELHQGRLTVDSNMGQGSRFTIKLPGRIVFDEPSAKVSPPKIDTKPDVAAEDIHILVTEDNQFNREVMGEILEEYQLDFAHTGEEAVKMASESGYDLILMDIQLPGIDGIDAMKQIRQNLDKYIPIVALTAYAMNGDQESLMVDGFDDYISKPFNIERLFKTIKHFTSR